MSVRATTERALVSAKDEERIVKVGAYNVVIPAKTSIIRLRRPGSDAYVIEQNGRRSQEIGIGGFDDQAQRYVNEFTGNTATPAQVGGQVFKSNVQDQSGNRTSIRTTIIKRPEVVNKETGERTRETITQTTGQPTIKKTEVFTPGKAADGYYIQNARTGQLVGFRSAEELEAYAVAEYGQKRADALQAKINRGQVETRRDISGQAQFIIKDEVETVYSTDRAKKRIVPTVAQRNTLFNQPATNNEPFPQATVSEAPKREGLGAAFDNVITTAQRGDTSAKAQAVGFALGSAYSLKSTWDFIEESKPKNAGEALLGPWVPAKRAAEGVITVIKDPTVLYTVGETLKTAPSVGVGFVVTELAQGKLIGALPRAAENVESAARAKFQGVRNDFIAPIQDAVTATPGKNTGFSSKIRKGATGEALPAGNGPFVKYTEKPSKVKAAVASVGKRIDDAFAEAALSVVDPDGILAVKNPAKRRVSKATLRQRSYGINKNPNIFLDIQKGEAGIRVRNPDLKKAGVSVRTIKKSTTGEVTIIDKGASPVSGRETLITRSGPTGETSFKGKPDTPKPKTLSGKKARLSTAREASKKATEFFTGKDSLSGVVVIEQRPSYTRPTPYKPLVKKPLPGPRLIIDNTGKAVSEAKEVTPKVTPKPTTRTRPGFRPGIAARLDKGESIADIFGIKKKAQAPTPPKPKAPPAPSRYAGGVYDGTTAQAPTVDITGASKGEAVPSVARRVNKQGVNTPQRNVKTAVSVLQADTAIASQIPRVKPASTISATKLKTDTLIATRQLKATSITPITEFKLGQEATQALGLTQAQGLAQEQAQTAQQVQSLESTLGMAKGVKVSAANLLGQAQGQSPATKQILTQLIETKPKEAVVTDFFQKPKQTQAPSSRESNRFTTPTSRFIDLGTGRGGRDPFTRNPPPPREETPRPKIPKGLSSREESLSFTTQVRKGGVFAPIARFASAAAAFSAGIVAVETSPAASFRVLKNGSVVENFYGTTKVKKSKREAGVFIEPNALRINTPGELSGITFKGIQSKKFGPKNIFGR